MQAELAQVDALPCSRLQLAICDGNGDTAAHQASLGVRRGIVHALAGFEVLVVVRVGHHAVLWGKCELAGFG